MTVTGMEIRAAVLTGSCASGFAFECAPAVRDEAAARFKGDELWHAD